MKFTGGVVTDLLLLLCLAGLVFVAYEIVELFNSVLTLGE
jgi:hypothetical protein